MYSRFVTWQKNPTFSSVIKIDDANQFIIDDETIDLRFALKGYGFKKVGEQNRTVHHFGCYKCYYRQVGATDWTLFAHATSAREASEGANVYKDITVTSGVLAQGRYEIKIVACRLIELSSWTGGIVEGIGAGDQFFYDVQARQNIPNKSRAIDVANIDEYVVISFDLINILAGIEYDEVVAVMDLLTIECPLAINVYDTVATPLDVCFM
jgi:hypothetical protein